MTTRLRILIEILRTKENWLQQSGQMIAVKLNAAAAQEEEEGSEI